MAEVKCPYCRITLSVLPGTVKTCTNCKAKLHIGSKGTVVKKEPPKKR